MKRLLGYFLVILAILGLAMAASLFTEAAQGKDVGDSVGGGFLMAGIGIAAGVLAYRRRRSGPGARRALSRDERDRLVLETAKASGGKITEAELSLESGLSLDESRAALERLAERGIVEYEVTSGGTIVYAFPGLISESEKATAKPAGEA